MYQEKNNIFDEPFENLVHSKVLEILREIESQPDEYYESVPIEEFKEYLIAKYTMEGFPELIWEETQMDFSETEVAGSDLPISFAVSDPNKRFTRKVAEFHVPIDGKPGLLRFHPSNIIDMGGIQGSLSIKDDSLCFSYIDIYNDPSNVESAFKSSKNRVIAKVNKLKNEFDKYHNDLPNFVQSELNKRIQKINHANDYKSKFKYPVKKKDVPTAFESPRVVKKKKITPKPVGTTKGTTNQRFISEEDYMHILGLLQDCGKNWEQHPEIYKNKDEEALRDQLIFVLALIDDIYNSAPATIRIPH